MEGAEGYRAYELAQWINERKQKKKLTADIRSYKDGGYGGFFGMSKICYNFKEWAQTCRQQDKGMEFEFRKIDMIPHEDACGKAKKYS